MKNSNTRTIINLIISIIASLALPTAIILIINEPTPTYQVIGTCASAGFLLGIVEFFVIGFSKRYIEEYSSISALIVGFALNFFAGTAVTLFYVTPILSAVFTILAIALLQLSTFATFSILGKVLQRYKTKE